ncbi:acyl-coenzyme A thioesterase 9, mitochondrial-like isoform X2 [Amphiura filiformis]
MSATSVPHIKNVREQLKELAGAQKQWGGERADRSGLYTQLVHSQTQLTPRTMKESYQEALIPLSSKPEIQEKYINWFKTIRIGKLLEDLDTFAVWISYQHNNRDELKSPLVIVTALVDRIDLHEGTICADSDIKMTGHVTWAGKTSMEVTMKLKQLKQDSWSDILQATFVMVARDPGNKGAAYVNPLRPETPEEEMIFQEGEVSKVNRKKEVDESLLKTAPTAEERELIHQMFVDSLDEQTMSFGARTKDEGSVWMEHTKLKNLLICFPQERNLYNKIFGGFLMRKATELAWANACMHSRKTPSFRAIDDIWFRKPVEVGSILLLLSEIAYTEGDFMQIRVHAQVVDHKTNKADTTNIFHFTLSCSGDVPPVVPKTYGESMLYLDGRRHFKEFMRTGIIDKVEETLGTGE